MRIGDAMEIDGLGRLQDVAIKSVEPPFGCASNPSTLPFSCIANLSLGAGKTETHRVVVTIPDAHHPGIGDGERRGRNCVAVLRPDTPVTGGLPIHVPQTADGSSGGKQELIGNGSSASGNKQKLVGNGSGGGGSKQKLVGNGSGGGVSQQHRAYSCHPFRLVHRKPKCSDGFVMNDAKRCVCPQGTSFRNGQCTGHEKPMRPVGHCTLLPGQVRTNDGRCVCPRGMELGRRGCFKPKPPARECGLLPGQIRTKSGKCVCPRGTKLEHGACRKPAPKCPEGTRLRHGRCVMIEQPRCPRGMEGRPPHCHEIEERQPQFIPGILLNPGILGNILPGREPHGRRPSRDRGRQ
jgi:hypothetical protein